MTGTFLYFAYGSNLLAKRIHINNPSAKRLTVGKIKDYVLEFSFMSKRWKGAAATIVSLPGSEVWGAVWMIDVNDRPNLDRQEGVHENVYRPLELDVYCVDNVVRKCRVYEQCNVPRLLGKGEERPDDRTPSKVYMDTILNGAVESGVPSHYYDFLSTFPHNGYEGNVDLHYTLSEK